MNTEFHQLEMKIDLLLYSTIKFYRPKNELQQVTNGKLIQLKQKGKKSTSWKQPTTFFID